MHTSYYVDYVKLVSYYTNTPPHQHTATVTVARTPRQSAKVMTLSAVALRQSAKVKCKSDVCPAGARQTVSQAEAAPIIPQIDQKVKRYLYKKRN